MKDIEMQLAMQCAPLIAGLKISNLLIIPYQEEREVIELLQKTEISCYRLLVSMDKVTLILFRQNELEAFIGGADVEKCLENMGYTEYSLDRILCTFRTRYREYMTHGGKFPHEMGLLLGYPVEDVEGFIENEGKNCLYSGYWKVYHNLSEKKKLFERFRLAREMMMDMISKGVKIADIMTAI